MPKKPTITEEQKDEVVQLYREGRKWREIAAEVGIAQPNIGWILRERGERKVRQKAPSEEISVAQALEQLGAVQREAERYKVWYEQEKLLNERLMAEVIELRSKSDGHPQQPVGGRAFRLHVAESEEQEPE